MRFAAAAVAFAGVVGLAHAHSAPRQLDLTLLVEAPKAFLSGLNSCFTKDLTDLEYMKCIVNSTYPATLAVVKILPESIQESVSSVQDTAEEFEAEIKTCLKKNTTEKLKVCVQDKLESFDSSASDSTYIQAINNFTEAVYECSQGPVNSRKKCTTSAVNTVLQSVVAGIVQDLLGNLGPATGSN